MVSAVWFDSYRLDRNSGQLFVNGRIMAGEYMFRVKVYDAVWKHEVISTVSVSIRDIRDDAIHNSASVRFHGKVLIAIFFQVVRLLKSWKFI